MSSLKLEVDSCVVESFPDVLIGGFLVDRLDAVPDRLPSGLFLSAGRRLAQEGLAIDRLVADPRIGGWREAIQRCGLKASTFKSSPEQLARRALKGGDISTPIPIVNTYCAVSLRHLAPLGGYDLDKLPEPVVRLRKADAEHDRFSPLGGKSKDMPLGPEVVVYASGPEIICWAFNHRDSRRTCLDNTTTRAVFFAEAVKAEQHSATREALGELAALLGDKGAECGETGWADRRRQQIHLGLGYWESGVWTKA